MLLRNGAGAERHILLYISNVGPSVTCQAVGFAGVKLGRLWFSYDWFAGRTSNARNENGRSWGSDEDIDVRTVGEDEAATLNQLFGEHHVLVFPKQQLTG